MRWQQDLRPFGRWVPGIVGLVAGVAMTLATSGCADRAVVRPIEEAGPPSVLSAADLNRRQAQAQRTVAALGEALARADAEAAAAWGAGPGVSLLRDLARNVERLGLVDVATRFVEPRSAALTGPETTHYGAGAWLGRMTVQYRIAGWDDRPTRVETTVVLAPDAEGHERIVGIGGHGVRTPIWLTGAARVARAPKAGVLVVGVGADVRHYRALARRAVDAVLRLLPDARGRLVVEVAPSPAAFETALGHDPRTDGPGPYRAVAGVTAATDGTTGEDAVVHVFLNPGVMGGLGPKGERVVIAHEATHVLADATAGRAPAWLAEGFADYVALTDTPVPVRQAAAQVLKRVHRDGPPRDLPGEEQLAPTAPGVGATYEEAWLAVRFLAGRFGEAALVRFYREVDAGMEVPRAFVEVFGEPQDDVVAAWSADVARLAATGRTAEAN